MLEFNADTPTSLFEAGVVQWYWLQDLDKTKESDLTLYMKSWWTTGNF
jgi:glutathionylspermidine synthase